MVELLEAGKLAVEELVGQLGKAALEAVWLGEAATAVPRPEGRDGGPMGLAAAAVGRTGGRAGASGLRRAGRSGATVLRAEWWRWGARSCG